MSKLNCFVITLLLLLFAFSTANASNIDEVYDDNSVWNYIVISNENDITPLKGVIIYMAGGGWNGTKLKKISTDCVAPYFVNHDILPDGYIVVQPQETNIGEFRDNPELVYKFVQNWRALCDKLSVKLIISGHSNGGGAAFWLLLDHPEIADGWAIFSGCRPKMASTDPHVPTVTRNVLMIYGGEGDGNQKGANEFEYLFGASYDLPEKNSYLKYVGGWQHSDTPKTLYKQFFWDWVDKV